MRLHSSYNKLGCHRMTSDIFSFSVYAPRALEVALVGDFNDWDVHSTPLKPSKSGVWSMGVKCQEGDKYQFAITGLDGETHYRIDPYGFAMAYNKSIVIDINKLAPKVPKVKTEKDFKESPLNIYEIHLGTWHKDYQTYREIAAPLVAHLKEYHYNAVQFMPLTEYPNDISWGYQVTGFYAPTSRYGKPEDLIYLIDRLHEAGIYCILDWVPAHFDKSTFGLMNYDGSTLYESKFFSKQDHPVWGTRYFDWSSKYVQSFLISSANFWLEKYGFDGLRIDTVSSILEYVDADPKTGYILGQEDNPDGRKFVRRLVEELRRLHPNAILIAEETRGYNDITSAEGLGFTYKQGLGWTWDTVHNFLLRNFHNVNELVYPMSYYFQNDVVIGLTHDQSSYQSGYMLGSSLPQGFLECWYMYMVTMPGKKMLFMGNEIGCKDEGWSYLVPIDWENKTEIGDTVKEINDFYFHTPALWDSDYEPTCWGLIHKNVQKGLLAYVRRGKEEEVICVFNFSEYPQEWGLDGMELVYGNAVPEDNKLPPYFYGVYKSG